MTGSTHREPLETGDAQTFSSFRVRPYLLTGGRTRSEIDLALETLVHVTDLGRSRTGTLGHELRSIAELCVQPQSVAEISAHLHIHLQVARILVGDLMKEGFVATHQATQRPSDRPDLRLLERVLDGLQSL